MATSTSKKVLVSRFDRGSVAGFVNPHSFLQSAGVELLEVSGNVLIVPYDDIKVVCFVRDFDINETWHLKRSFTARPKLAGLWVRIRFRDGDTLEGVLPHNLLAQDPQGFTFIPPDPSAQNQKIFTPRSALAEVQVLGVVGSLLRQNQRRTKAAKAEDPQMGLFS